MSWTALASWGCRHASPGQDNERSGCDLRPKEAFPETLLAHGRPHPTMKCWGSEVVELGVDHDGTVGPLKLQLCPSGRPRTIAGKAAVPSGAA